jgi:penicillin amidase
LSPLVAQVSGTIEVDGLAAPVRVVRDRWGVPHLYAQSLRDLFVAQGFVQAQDRLFQMDLWRRSAQGRLSEVLGPNFIERDAMTRRVQYRGDLAREWSSYGPDARAIARAFVDGVNAWAMLARARPPEPFALAGWIPDLWSAEDLLNRTDGFEPSGGARAAIARKQMDDVVADAIRRVGAPPFFMLLTMPAPSLRHADGRDRELVSPLATIPVGPSAADIIDSHINVAESGVRYAHPALRYVIHLSAPGWNVIGATAPWRPGIAVGHNEQIAWAMSPADRETQDVVEQPVDPATRRVVKDTLIVKGRSKAFEFETEFTPDGVVIASDHAHGRNFVLQWRGFDSGTAPELAALQLDRSTTRDEFQAAAARWQLPPRTFVLVERDGRDTAGRTDGKDKKERKEGKDGQVRPLERAMFAHPLAITDAARARFDVGPLVRPSQDQQFRAQFTPRDWDQSTIINAPGQSESPDSAHFADLALRWSAGEMVPLVFSDAAVQANSESVLMLVPKRK